MVPASEISMSMVKPAPSSTSGPAEIGAFITEWTNLEAFLVGLAREKDPRALPLSMKASIDVLKRHKLIKQSLAEELHELRRFRNDVVHRGEGLSSNIVLNYTRRIRNVRQRIQW